MHRARRAIGVAAVALVAVLSGFMGPVTPPAARAQGTGIEVLGELAHGCDGAEQGTRDIKPLVVDTDNRRLYARGNCPGGDRIHVYDLTTEVPTLVRVGPAVTFDKPYWPTNTVALAPERGRLYILAPTTTSQPTAIIEAFDLETLESEGSWTVEAQVPGFQAMGLMHDPDRNRLYLTGGFEGNAVIKDAANLAGTIGETPRAAIVALDDTSGERIWVNPLRDCDAVMWSGTRGSTIGMSELKPRLYTFCQGASTGGTGTGQAGLVRVDVSDQDQVDATGVAHFPAEFFPVSGNYSATGPDGGGVSTMDPRRERFFVHSLSSRTHGAWVFDGQRSSWIGFVASPNDDNKHFGLDLATGKHYMGGNFGGDEGGWINVTDGGATPVPQGRLFTDFRSTTPWARDQGALDIDTSIVVDPATGRLFVGYREATAGALVLRDTTPPITPRTPLDLDELTHDIADDDEARLEFSANTSGFGAQYVQVGGWENVYSRIGFGAFDEIVWTALRTLYPGIDNPASIRYGNRGATMSLVEGVGIAESGASASAIATKPDENTPGDAETKQSTIEKQANDATGGGFDDLAEAVDDAAPDDDDSDGQAVQEARYVTCLDGADDGEKVTDEQGSAEEPAHSKVVCDLTNLTASARARFSGGSGGGGVIVSDSSFDGKTYRDPERGVVTETEAMAKGVVFGEAGLGGFTIDRVISTATTWAKGLDGEAHVKWVRTVEGMRTIGADGTMSEPTSCTTIIESGKERREEGDIDCESQQRQLNELMPNRFEVKFPLPEVVATPGGAFASVQEDETDFLSGRATNNDDRRMVPGMEMTVFADGDQRGRLWVQLAAVKADATFIRTPIYESGDVGGGGQQTIVGTPSEPSPNEPAAPADNSSGGGPVAIPVPGDDEAPQPEVDQDPPTIPVSHQETFVGAFGWLPALRSAGDAALTGALYVLFLLPAAEVVRRRRLLDVLTDAPATDGLRTLSKRPVAVSASPVRSTS